MNASGRLLQLLEEPEVQLDRIAAVLGGLSVPSRGAGASPAQVLSNLEDEVVTTFDELASDLSEPADADDVIQYVFGELGFRGNSRDYYSPANSTIQEVLASRTGVPLTLSVVAMEIGRRVGVKLLAIGMPGHFLLAEGPTEGSADEKEPNAKLAMLPSRFFDPFSAGRELNAAACQEIFEQLMSEQSFELQMLLPVGPASIAARMLQNLRVVYLRQGDVSRLAAVLQVRVELPGIGPNERLEYSKILGALGRYDQAAEQLDLLAQLEPDRAKHHRSAAKRHRARRN